MANAGGTCGSKCADSVDLGATADAIVYVLYVLTALELIAGVVWCQPAGAERRLAEFPGPVGLAWGVHCKRC